jgi:penicillin-binding protein 1A
VWVGYDDNKPLGSGETGASAALPAWVSLMKAAHENKPRAEFPKPPGVVTVAIDPKTGARATSEEGAIDEVFLDGTDPNEAPPPTDDGGAEGGAPDAGGPAPPGEAGSP